MATLFEDALRLIQQQDRRSPAWRRLSHNHGAAGIVLGALIDVFAAGNARSFQDLQNAIRTAKASGYLQDASLYRGSPYASPTSQEEIVRRGPYTSRSPILADGPGTSVAPVQLGVPYTPSGADRGGTFRVDTVPRPPDLEAPPTAMGPTPVGDMVTPSPGRRPGGLSTAPGGKSGVWDSRSPLAVKTVSQPGQRQSRVAEHADYTRGAMVPPSEGEVDVFADMIMTPESSNVYGFTYDEVRGVLYVVYRAPLDPVGERRWTNSCTGEDYTLQVRPFVPGPMYAYGGRSRPVPKWMFEELKGASSKGTWVWDRLRVCGSFYEHQFPYTLASPAMEGILYVPRKATRKGFRVRSVATIGKGRRSYLTSNLPDNLFNQ